MGKIRAFFQMSGSSARLTDRLKMRVRYLIPKGPRCLRCSIVSWSGPVAVELLDCFIAAAVSWSVKGAKDGSSLCCFLTLRSVRRRSGSRVCAFIQVNCLVNCLAMAEGLEKVLLAPSLFKNEIGWLGAARVLFPERDRIRFQNFETLCLWETEET